MTDKNLGIPTESSDSNIQPVENLSSNLDAENLSSRYNRISSNYDIAIENIGRLRENFPDEYELLQSNYPELFARIEDLSERSNTFTLESTSPEEMNQVINEYNSFARSYNLALLPIIETRDATNRELLENSLSSDNFDLDSVEGLSETDRQEIIDLASQLITETLMPETRVGRIIRGISGEISGEVSRNEEGEIVYGDLNFAQRVAIVPAQAIELTLGAIARLFRRDTYRDISQGVGNVLEMSREEWGLFFDGVNDAWRQLNNQDRIIGALQIISAILTLRALLGVAGVTSTTARTLARIGVIASQTNVYLRAIPLATLNGLRLNSV